MTETSSSVRMKWKTETTVHSLSHCLIAVCVYVLIVVLNALQIASVFINASVTEPIRGQAVSPFSITREKKISIFTFLRGSLIYSIKAQYTLQAFVWKRATASVESDWLTRICKERSNIVEMSAQC